MRCPFIITGAFNGNAERLRFVGCNVSILAVLFCSLFPPVYPSPSSLIARSTVHAYPHFVYKFFNVLSRCIKVEGFASPSRYSSFHDINRKTEQTERPQTCLDAFSNSQFFPVKLKDLAGSV